MSDTSNPPIFADLATGKQALLARVAVETSAEGLRLELPSGERIVWPWGELRKLRDQADQETLALSRAGDRLSRLYVKDRDLIVQVAAQAPRLSKVEREVPLRKLAIWAVGAIAAVNAIMFLLVPLMAAQLATILPPKGEKALGDATLEQIKVALDETGIRGVATCEDQAGTDALMAMYERLNPYADLPYDVQMHVLDHDLVNAFALPGGHIVFFKGLLEEADSPDEIAAVMAHEIGHVVNRDPTTGALRSAGSVGVLGLLFGDFAGGTVMLFLANQLINATYSQKAETLADDYAHALLHEAGVSPSALGSFFNRLHEEHGDAEGIVAHFASHPQMRARIDAAEAAVDQNQTYQTILNEEEWGALQTICGASYDSDGYDETDSNNPPPVSDSSVSDKKTWK